MKKVEVQIGIARSTAGLSGWDAPKLWYRYETMGDHEALALLLRYNRDDVINLPRLRAHLHRLPEEPVAEHTLVWNR